MSEHCVLSPESKCLGGRDCETCIVNEPLFTPNERHILSLRREERDVMYEFTESKTIEILNSKKEADIFFRVIVQPMEQNRRRQQKRKEGSAPAK